MMRKILLLNGPNLDMLGIREPGVYGNDTLGTLEAAVKRHAMKRGVELGCYQSNSEGKLIGKIHGARDKYDGIVYNPGAHTHYSYALRDAVASVDVPVVEVHLSDIETREAFRRVSVIAPACVAQVKGLGIQGYCRAIDILCDNGPLDRLGEGYEQRYSTADNVIVSGLSLAEDLGEPIPYPTAAADAQAGDAASDDEPPTGSRKTLESLPTITIASAKAVSGAHAKASAEEADDVPIDAADDGSGEEAAEGSRELPIAAPAAAASADRTAPLPLVVEEEGAGALSSRRLQMVRDAYQRLGVGALLVRDTPNIAWLSAFDGAFDEERAHALVVAQDLALLHTDTRYSNALRMLAAKNGNVIAVDDERKSHAQCAYDALLGDKAGENPLAGKLGLEDTITYAEFVKLVDAFGSDNLAPTTDVVLGLRAVKDAEEIRRLRVAQAITDAAFAFITAIMKPGMTEREVQLELEDYMVRHGAEGLAFRSIVATGANGADPHAVPGETRLEAGQCVVMDFGARACGYCSDMTRTVFLGAPDPQSQMARAWETLRRANEEVERALAPGMTGKQAHELAERILAEGGFEGKMGHGLGHGVGMEVHELPMLNLRNDEPLAAGNVVTVEPGIYLPGQFGMRLEDFGVVTAEGFDVFTKSTHEMVVI